MESDRIRPRLVIGLVLITAAISSLLERAHVFDRVELELWWPLVPIVLGLSKLARRPEEQGGWGLLALGGWLLAINVTPLQFGETWPLFVLVWGGSMIWQGLSEADLVVPTTAKADLKVRTTTDADLKVRTTTDADLKGRTTTQADSEVRATQADLRVRTTEGRSADLQVC